MNMEVIKSFVKSHKDEIVIIAGGVEIIVGIGLFAWRKKSNSSKKKPLVLKIKEDSDPKILWREL